MPEDRLMNKSDHENFVDVWLTAHESSASNKQPSNNAVNYVFELLCEYSIEHIKKALSEHGNNCKFAPTPADVVKILQNHSIYGDSANVECPSVDEILALARLADTPLGVLAMVQIGSYDLNNQDLFYLKQRAQEVILKFDDYVARCRAGDYTRHEIETMKKYGVNFMAPMAKGLPRPGKGASVKMIKLSNSANEPQLRLVK